MKKILGKMIYRCAVCLMLCTVLVGCNSVEGNQNTEKENRGTYEEAEELDKQNQETADDSQESSGQNETTTLKKSIAESGYAIAENKVSRNEGLYRLELSIVSADAWIIDMVACGDNLLLFVDNMGNPDSEFMLYLVDPLNMEIIAEQKLPSGSYYEGDIYVNAENDIAVVDEEHGSVYFCDSNLNGYSEANVGRAGIGKCYPASDFSKIYYMDQTTYEVFCYDVVSGTETLIISDIVYDSSEYVSIAGVWSEQDYIMLSMFNFDTNRDRYELRNIFTGEIVEQGDTEVTNYRGENKNYIVKKYIDGLDEVVYGSLSDDTEKVLVLADYNEYYSVLTDVKNQVVITQAENENTMNNTKDIIVSLYDLASGRRENVSDFCFDISENYVYATNAVYIGTQNIVVLNLGGIGDGLYVWDLTDENTYISDDTNYSYDLNSLDNLTDEEYSKLKEKADEIGTRNSVEVYFGEDINNCSRDIYEYVPATNIARIDRSLDILSEALDRYPKGMLAEISEGEGGVLKIYLSGQILSADETAITTAVGVQSMLIDDSYIVLDIYSIWDYESSIYHELYHTIESYLLMEGFYYDDEMWNSYNPTGFSYDYDYIANVDNYDYSYIVGDAESEAYFIDTYSKSFPHEDRARIMEYAMMEEKYHRGYFENEPLNNKLQGISSFIRGGFDTSDWPEVTAWEAVIH